MSDNGVPGYFYDGLTAHRHPVTITPTPDGNALSIQPETGASWLWPMDRLRAVNDAPDQLTLTVVAQTSGGESGQRDAARLVLSEPSLRHWIRAYRKSLNRRDVHPGTVKRLTLHLGAAVAAMAVILFVLIPSISNSLARSLPTDQEVAFGKAIVQQMTASLEPGQGDLVCDNPAGRQALNKLKLRMTAGQGLTYDIGLTVLDSDIVNAFAAPGGQIVILRGLLDDATSAEELAGVLAHEIGHVEARDPTRLAFRAVGSAGILSLLFGDVSGGAAITLAGNYLMSTAYTRDAETAADLFAMAMLRKLRIDTVGLASFFERIDKIDGDLPSYLTTHPPSVNRASLARMNRLDASVPVILDGDWQALKAICD